MIGLLILSLLAVSLACAFYGKNLLTWTGSMIAAIALFAVTGAVTTATWVIAGLVLAVVAVPLNVKDWRRQLQRVSAGAGFRLGSREPERSLCLRLP